MITNEESRISNPIPRSFVNKAGEYDGRLHSFTAESLGEFESDVTILKLDHAV